MTQPTDCLTPDCAGKQGDFRQEENPPPPFRLENGRLTRMVKWRCRVCQKPVYSVGWKKK